MSKYIAKLRDLVLSYILCIILVLSMSVGLLGCRLTDSLTHTNHNNDEHTTVENNQDFTDYINELFATILSSDTMSLHAYVEHPENFGINDYDVTLGRYDLDNLNDTSDCSDVIATLKSFDRNSLSAKQQITYDEILMYMENILEYSDLYMFDTQLQTTTGVHVQLPLLFAEYTFAEKKDVDEYIQLLNDVDGYMNNLVAYEKLRSEKGYFMEDTLADKVIESCTSFLQSASDENGVMISTFNEKIVNVPGLSENDISDYKKKNTDAVNAHVSHGYQALIDGLSSLKGTNK